MTEGVLYNRVYSDEMKKQTVIEEWHEVEPPPPPELKKVNVNPKETALLVLDIQKQNCNEERPRCLERILQLKEFLHKARHARMMVVYSLTRSAEKGDIREEVTPHGEDFVVKAGVDKFFQTDLEPILRAKHIKYVIIVGTSAHGAVLHTAVGAAARGFEVVVPVDGLSANEAYAEQYTVWHIAYSPGTKRRATLTELDWITFENVV